MGKEAGLMSTDEPQARSPMMACRGFAIPANTAQKGAEVSEVGRRRRLVERISEVSLGNSYPVGNRHVRLEACDH